MGTTKKVESNTPSESARHHSQKSDAAVQLGKEAFKPRLEQRLPPNREDQMEEALKLKDEISDARAKRIGEFMRESLRRAKEG